MATTAMKNALLDEDEQQDALGMAPPAPMQATPTAAPPPPPSYDQTAAAPYGTDAETGDRIPNTGMMPLPDGTVRQASTTPPPAPPPPPPSGALPPAPTATVQPPQGAPTATDQAPYNPSASMPQPLPAPAPGSTGGNTATTPPVAPPWEDEWNKGVTALDAELNRNWEGVSRRLGEHAASRGIVGSSVEGHMVREAASDQAAQRARQLHEMARDRTAAGQWSKEFGLRQLAMEYQKLGMDRDEAFRQASLDWEKSSFGQNLDWQKEYGRGRLDVDRDMANNDILMSTFGLLTQLLPFLPEETRKRIEEQTGVGGGVDYNNDGKYTEDDLRQMMRDRWNQWGGGS